MGTLSGKRNYAVVRRPIFNKDKGVVAYNLELVDLNPPPGTQGSYFITEKTIDDMVIEGMKKLAEGKKVFLYFDSQAIINELPLSFSPDTIGVNIESEGAGKKPFLDKVKKIKSEGFEIVVDCFDMISCKSTLVQLADILTADFRIDRIKKKSTMSGIQDAPEKKILARDVETEADFEMALDKEFDYFQGSFFYHPDIIPVQDIPSFKLNLLRLLRELNKSEISFEEIEDILKRDVALTYKLLKFINSASIGIKTTVKSIKHALDLLGETEVKKWLTIMVVSSVGSDKPQELLKSSLIRAKFCELIATTYYKKANISNYFLTGMFSLMDVFVGRPIIELISDLPLEEEIKEALIGETNLLGEVLSLVIDYESGRWDAVKEWISALNYKESDLIDFYQESIEWSRFIEQVD